MTSDNLQNTVLNASAKPVWIARKGETILAQSDSEKGAWRLLGVRGKKQKAELIAAGFQVTEAHP